MSARIRRLVVIGLVVVVGAVPSLAQEPAGAPPAAHEGADLAKKLANPVSDLVSVPFQFNWEQSVGPNDGTRFILNVQPVMPFAMSEDWNLIARVIVPFVGQPALAEGGSPALRSPCVAVGRIHSPATGSVIENVAPPSGLFAADIVPP